MHLASTTAAFTYLLTPPSRLRTRPRIQIGPRHSTNPSTAHTRTQMAAPGAQAEGFSLGAAVFGGVPDATCAQPTQQVPLAALRLLVRKHADSAALCGLFTSCRAGRDVVLQHAPQATLTLSLLHDQSHEQWVAQHRQIKAALITRGCLPTRLYLDGWMEGHAPNVSIALWPMELLVASVQSARGMLSDTSTSSSFLRLRSAA